VTGRFERSSRFCLKSIKIKQQNTAKSNK